MRFLITTGPTREYLDPVRFLTNASSGKMGYACAAAAQRRGHKVVLVSGPVERPQLRGVKLIKVVTAAQMAQAVAKHFDKSDCVIMTAAVCDYRPKIISGHKLRKGKEMMQLDLERTEDILTGLGKAKGDKILIGFAVQDRAARKNARKKLKEKNLDAIVLNSPTAFGVDKSDVQILRRGSKWERFTDLRKTSLGVTLIKLAEELTG